MDKRKVDQKEALSLHEISNFRAGKGIFVQHVPDPGPSVRSGTRPQTDRAAGQNLVSESTHENEENEHGYDSRQQVTTKLARFFWTKLIGWYVF